MNDQEKAREKLNWVMDEAVPNAMWRSERRKMLDAVLSADPRVIAEAMSARMVLMHCAHRDVPEQWAILLPPRKVEP